MKKIFKNKYVQFVLIILVLIFLFSVLFPKTKAAGFFRSSFFYLTSGIEGFFHRPVPRKESKKAPNFNCIVNFAGHMTVDDVFNRFFINNSFKNLTGIKQAFFNKRPKHSSKPQRVVNRSYFSRQNSI